MAVVRVGLVAGAVALLGTGVAAALLTVSGAAATVTATARSLSQVTGVTATAALGSTTVRWSAEGSGLTTGYRVERWATAGGGTPTAVCAGSTTSTGLSCTDTGAPLTGAFYSVAAVLTVPGAAAPAWTGPESSRAGSGAAPLPAPSVPDLTTDSGTSATDNVTSTAAPVFVGTGTPGATVTLAAGGTVLGTALVTGAGTWQVTSTALAADGVRTVTATQALLGTTSAPSAGLVVTVDRTAPVVTVGTATGNGNSGSGTVTGTAGVLSGDLPAVSLLFTQTGSAPTSGSTTASGSTWSFAYALGRGGSYQVQASQRDIAGNTGTATATITT